MTGKRSKSSKQQDYFTKDNPLCAGGLRLFVGAKIEALDSRRWYQAKIVKINESTYRVLVHFEGWNSRHDKWFDYDSSSLRPLSLHEVNQDDSSKRKELKPGDRVLARWSDSKFYPAKIHALVNEKICEVIFFDGFKKRLNRNSIRPDPKRTFENFEEKIKIPPNGAHPATPSTSVGEVVSKPLLAPGSGSRTKRRHTEPSTMADFVTSIPGKRSKNQLGTPSDSDDVLSPHETWEHKTKEDGIESHGGSSSGVKRGLALRKQRRLGYPVDEDMPISKIVRTSTEEKLKNFTAGDGLPSSTQSPLSNKECGRMDELEEDGSIPLLNLAKRKPISNILQIKLPLKVQGRRRGRKKRRFFRLDKDDSSAVDCSGGTSSEKRAEMANAESDVPFKAAEQSLTAVDTDSSFVQPSAKSSEEDQKTHSEDATHMKNPIQKTEDQSSRNEALKDQTDKHFALGLKTEENGASKDTVKGADGRCALLMSKTMVRVPKRRGRKPGKSNLAKTCIREPKVFPKRERKLTEKGLELLQIIGHKKGTECHLKEAFVSGDVAENLNLKDDATDNLKSVPREEQGTDKIDDAWKEQHEQRDRDKIKIDGEEVLKLSDEKSDILQDEKRHRHDSLPGESPEVKRKGGAELKVESDTMTEDHDMSRDDDRCSEASEGSGSLVIDIADDLTASGDIGQRRGDSCSGTALKNRRAKSSDIIHDKDVDIKPRLFPRLKYTLSHEERRGNKLAKLKKNRLKKKRRGARGKAVRESVKEVENVVIDSQKAQSLDRSQLPPSNQASANVSPLESLTRMVTETADVMDSPSDGKTASLPDAHISTTIEETNKPVKSSKQQRAPYKPRLKMTDNFLSMVEQDRPSQIDRPLADDLIKERSLRGRSRHRFANRADNQNYQESAAKKREEAQQGDLNEPLEFSASSPSMETIDLSKTDMKSIGYPRQTMTSFVGERNRYGPGHRGTFAATSNTVAGQMRLPHPSQQFDLYQAGSSQASISPLSIVNSESLGYDKIAPNSPRFPAYQGMIGLPEGRAPLLNYPAHLHQMIGPKGTSNSPDCAPSCLRMQGPGIASQGSWESQKRIENCPCQECRSLAGGLVKIVDKESSEAKQGTDSSSHRVASPCQGEASGARKNEGMLVPSAANVDKNSTIDQEFVITDVFSLRDSSNMISRVGAPSKTTSPFDVKEQKNAGSGSHGLPGKKEIIETVRESPKEASEAAHAAGKPKEFETKKKRLDLITGKLSAQKRLSPYDDALLKGDKNEREISSPAASIKSEEAAKPLSPFSKQSTVKPEQPFKPQQIGYMYPQTSFMPVMNPYYDPKLGIPPSSLDVPPARVISPESHMVPHHPIYMDPRPYFPSPEYFQPIRPVYDAEGIPPLSYQHPSPGMPYMTPDMVGHMRFHQLPGFPYYPPRFAPVPRYFGPREALPMATAHPPPPPYSTFPMVSSPQRLRTIAPSGRIPLVVCKQTNCNCHLPHSAPPIQLLPPNSQTTQASEKTSEDDDAVLSTGQAATNVSEPMMKGDPRRLTLPLQRMKKMGSKIGKGSKESALSKNGCDQSPFDDVEKEDEGLNESVEGQDELEAENDGGSCKTPSISRSEDRKIGKFDNSKKNGAMKKHEKGQKREPALAPREFVVKLELNEFQCKFKGCKKSFRKASSRDNHQRYFHSPRVPQRKRKPSSSLPSPAAIDVPASPAFAQTKTDPKVSNEDLTSIRSGYSSSVVTDDNISDHEKPEETSSDESDDSFLDSNGSVCVDDIIRCKCGELEEQGFMIQCEQCFTWQHGDCVDLTVQSVPKNYLCYVCLHPKGLRPSYKYKNNYDWYKRGTLPSLIELEDENQEKIAELMQASHALMEDITNVFDVIAGMKKKIAVLNEAAHPALRFWKPIEESKDKEQLDNKVNHEMKDGKAVSMELKPEEEDKDKSDAMKDGNGANGQKEDLVNEINAISLNKDSVNGTDRDGVSHENSSLGQNPNGGTSTGEVSSLDDGSEKSMPANGMTGDGTAIVNEGSKGSCDKLGENAEGKSNFVEGKNEANLDETAQNEPSDIVSAKLKLQDHLDDIEDKLNQRMDEIESNIDVLEQKYIECEKKVSDGEPKSAFKIALPDMTSIVRHLNMINRQLMNIS